MVVAFCGAAPALAANSTVNVASSGALFYNAGEGQANNLTISGDGASLTVTDTGTDAIEAGAGCAATVDNPQSVTCGSAIDPELGVNQIEVKVRDLDDTVTLSTGLIAEVFGQNGNDMLTGGSGADILWGGVGDDVVNGGEGDDALIGESGNDQLIGGSGSDTADFAAGTGATVDLKNTGSPQDTGAGMDILTAIENVNGSTTGSDFLTGDSAPNTFIGSGGNDTFSVEGDSANDVVACGTGSDSVTLDRDTDRVRGVKACELVDDGRIPDTNITAGPSGPVNPDLPDTPLSWEFSSDEPWADFQCTVVDTEADVFDPATAWEFCESGYSPPVPPEGASKVFAVRAVDGQTNEDPTPDMRAFTVDTEAPDTAIDSGPSGGAVTTTPTPEFFFSSPDPEAGFYCRIDLDDFVVCANPYTTEPLADGEHTLEVVAIDAAGNLDQTPATVTFRVDTAPPGPGPGDGPPPSPASPQSPPPVQQAKIIIGSLVLISGNSVRMSRKGRVSIGLTCAGASRCTGRLRITTAKPVRKRSRKLVTLGSRRFRIPANKKRKIKVRFAKRKMRLARRLKRFKAKAVIREIDPRGNPRISSRIFILRAR